MGDARRSTKECTNVIYGIVRQMKIKGLWGDNLDTYHQLCDKVVIHGIRKRVVTVDIVNPFEEKESFSKGKTIDWM